MNLRARRAFVPRTLAAILLSAASLAASAQSGTALVTGTISGPMGPGVFEHVVFNCTGTPTCTGQYTESYKIDECSNSLDFSGVITITGMNLAVTGSFEGLLTMASWLYGIERQTDGSCRIVPPIASRSFWSAMMSMMGCVVVGSISVLLASAHPRTSRATSMAAMCRP